MGKVTKIIRKTASVMLASVMTGTACSSAVMAAPVSSPAQQTFSLGRVGALFDNIKDLITGNGEQEAIEKDSHKTADAFASKRLIVKADNLKGVDKKNIIGSYDDYYLLKYSSKADAKEAYEDYSNNSADTATIAADQPVHMATGSADAGGLTNVTKSSNPLAELKDNASDITKADVKKAKKQRTIALLDTGASTSSNVIESVSMLGGSGADDNGHGEAMVKAITSQNKDAKIISIKVLDRNGEGSVSSIVAGIAYAEKRGAEIINMSLAGRATQGNSIVTAAVSDAINKGLVVVGSAGNYNADAKGYIPGDITNALIVGACDSNGNRISSSNYGETVDYNVSANSTSEAAAIASGYISAHMNDDGSYTIPVNEANLFFKPDQNKADVINTKSSVIIPYLRGQKTNINAKLYSGGKVVDKLGDKSKKYEVRSIDINAMKISTSEDGIGISYPNGILQYYTDKNIVLNITPGNFGEYYIYSVNNIEDIKKLEDEKDSVFKNPQSIKALNDRKSKNTFTAQSYPSSLSGTATYNANAEHGNRMFPVTSVHVDGYDSAHVKYTSDAHCLDRGYWYPRGTYRFTSSKRTKKEDGWQWYRVDTAATQQTSPPRQRMRLSVAIKQDEQPTERTVKKVWKGHKKVPVTVQLKRYKSGRSDGYVAGTKIVLNEQNNWTYKKTGLPTESDDGKKYTYKWIEITKFKDGVSRITKSDNSQKLDTIINTGKPEPEQADYSYSIHKTWIGDDYPENIEILARLTYTHNKYNTNNEGKRTTLASSTEGHNDYTVNADKEWTVHDTKSVTDKEKEEYKDFKWTEYAWRYAGTSAWQTNWDAYPMPKWERGRTEPYDGKDQAFLNYAAPTTKMTIEKDWDNTVVADAVTFRLEGQTPEGTIDCGTVTLTKDNGWSGEIGKNATIKCPAFTYPNGDSYAAQTITHDLPVYYTRTVGKLDFHVPTTYDEGYHVDEATAELYKIKYQWVEVGASYRGHDLNRLIASCKVVTDEQPEEGDYENGGSGSAVNTSVNPTITSAAADASTGTKAGRVITDSDGNKHLRINETVNIWNVGPGNQYTLNSGIVFADDGTEVEHHAYVETVFIPEQINTFQYLADGRTFVSLNISLDYNIGTVDPSGRTVTVTEYLADDELNDVAAETNKDNKDQMVYYPEIKTHMVSVNPSKKYGSTMNGTAGDTDGKHFGTLQDAPNGTVTMVDTVTYKNVYTGSYVLDGVLHRRGRTTSPGQDLGAVTTGSASLNVSAGDGAASGTVDVTYTFKFPESYYGGDFVSFETLKASNGETIVDHADISDGKQTVRMPTSFRILKREAKQPDKPIAGVTYQLFTKDEAGNLNPYKRDDGSDYILTTGADGTVEFRDLDIGKYWIKEIKVPKGVSLQATPFEINAVESKVFEIKNENIDTPKLTTGGSGTSIYYIAAMAIAGLSFLALYVKKRKYN